MSTEISDDEHLLVAADHLAEALDRRGSILVADRRAAFQELIEKIADRVLFGRYERVTRRSAARHAVRDAEPYQLPHAVLDVESHAPERVHQRFDVVRLIGARAHKAEQRRPERRLHERLESRLDFR